MMTDNEIRRILQERKRAEHEAEMDKKWKEAKEWLKAFAITGFASWAITLSIF